MLCRELVYLKFAVVDLPCNELAFFAVSCFNCFESFVQTSMSLECVR